MVNYKGIVLEYCQKKQLPFPIFQLFQTEILTENLQPTWICKVVFNNKVYVGKDFTRKKDAENYVSEIICKDLNLCSLVIPVSFSETMLITTPTATKTEKLPQISTNFESTVILVDLENIHKIIYEIIQLYNNQIPDHVHIIGFIGEHHSLIEKITKLQSEKITIVKVKSTRSDGVDCCMQVMVGTLLINEEYETYLIATRDKFGGVLVDMITLQDNLWIPKKAKLTTTLQHIAMEV